MQMSKLLSGYTSDSATKTSFHKTANTAATGSSNSETQQAMALLSGAVISGGNISDNINTVNQSPRAHSGTRIKPRRSVAKVEETWIDL